MASDGKIITIDKNEELETLQNKYFEKSGFRNQIEQKVGNAVNIIPKIDRKFDLVFIDADKSNYINYFHLIIDKMNSGGIILSDNVLWSGKIIEVLDPKDNDTKVLLAYNKLLNSDDRIETVLLPIRDGLTISRVK
jgi:predicted O-methyltransferase YrrM